MTTGFRKLLIILVATATIFILQWPSEPEAFLSSPVVPFVTMIILIPGYYLMIRKETKEKLIWPNWNASLFDLRENQYLEILISSVFYLRW